MVLKIRELKNSYALSLDYDLHAKEAFSDLSRSLAPNDDGPEYEALKNNNGTGGKEAKNARQVPLRPPLGKRLKRRVLLRHQPEKNRKKPRRITGG